MHSDGRLQAVANRPQKPLSSGRMRPKADIGCSDELARWGAVFTLYTEKRATKVFRLMANCASSWLAALVARGLLLVRVLGFSAVSTGAGTSSVYSEKLQRLWPM